MKILAMKCKKCNNVIYSRTGSDYRTCDCGAISIDSKGRRRIGQQEDYTELYLDGDVLLEMILFYDYQYGNRNVSPEFKDGYYGKFRIDDESNKEFFDRLLKITK